MPHDKNGRLIEKGDVVKVVPVNASQFGFVYGDGKKVVGPVTEMNASETCSGKVLVPVLGGYAPDYFNAQDAELILKADGTEPS